MSKFDFKGVGKALAITAGIVGSLILLTNASGGTSGGNSTSVAKPRLVTVTSGYTFNGPKNESTSSLEVRAVTPDANKVIFLTSGIDKGSVDDTINAIEKARNAGLDEVYLVIDSPGGNVLDGAKLVTYMKASKVKINTVCETICASMGFHIFEAGHKRLMLEKAVLMGHPASGGARGTIEEMKSMIDMIKLYVDRLDADIAARAGIPFDEFKVMMLNNTWLEGRDALAKNLADEIVTLEITRPANVMFIFGSNKATTTTPSVAESIRSFGTGTK